MDKVLKFASAVLIVVLLLTAWSFTNYRQVSLLSLTTEQVKDLLDAIDSVIAVAALIVPFIVAAQVREQGIRAKSDENEFLTKLESFKTKLSEDLQSNQAKLALDQEDISNLVRCRDELREILYQCRPTVKRVTEGKLSGLDPSLVLSLADTAVPHYERLDGEMKIKSQRFFQICRFLFEDAKDSSQTADDFDKHGYKLAEYFDACIEEVDSLTPRLLAKRFWPDPPVGDSVTLPSES